MAEKWLGAGNGKSGNRKAGKRKRDLTQRRKGAKVAVDGAPNDARGWKRGRPVRGPGLHTLGIGIRIGLGVQFSIIKL